MQRIVLASGSPRRREILELLGLEFEVIESGFDEDRVVSDDPSELVEELALQKALLVSEQVEHETIVVAGDTVVHMDGEILSKLESEEEVRRVIRLLSGREHEVYTGVSVVGNGERYVGSDVSRVKFLELSEDRIDEYVRDGRWRGYAAGYALQGAAADLIEGYDGRLSTIIGMPIEITVELLERVGVNVEVDANELEEIIRDMKVGIDD